MIGDSDMNVSRGVLSVGFFYFVAVFFAEYVGANKCQKVFAQTDKCQKEWQCTYGCAENRDRLIAAAANGVNRDCLDPDTNYAGSALRTLTATCADHQMQHAYSDGMFTAANCQTAAPTAEYQACLVKTPYRHGTVLLYALWMFTFSFLAIVTTARHSLFDTLSFNDSPPPPYSGKTTPSAEKLLASSPSVESSFFL